MTRKSSLEHNVDDQGVPETGSPPASTEVIHERGTMGSPSHSWRDPTVPKTIKTGRRKFPPKSSDRKLHMTGNYTSYVFPDEELVRPQLDLTDELSR